MPAPFGGRSRFLARAPSIPTVKLNADQLSAIRETIHDELMVDRFGGLANDELAERIAYQVGKTLDVSC